jgi:hypothetical protein
MDVLKNGLEKTKGDLGNRPSIIDRGEVNIWNLMT